MKRIRTTIGVATAVCAFCVLAVPALAAEFVTTGGATRGKGAEQTILLPPFIINCRSAQTTGEAHEANANEVLDRISFKHCVTQAKLNINTIELRTIIPPLVVVYHATGFVETGALEEPVGEAWLASGAIELKIPSLKQEGEPCVISWQEQNIPNSVKFTNLALPHSRSGLAIENTFAGIEFEYSGGQCGEFNQAEKLKKDGSYTGDLTDEIKQGSLEWKP